MTVQPGRQLAGRYRVEDLLAERAGARLWRAVDEVLRRSVAIEVLPSDSPRASALVQAARRSAVVTDGRFLRVLDAAEENGDVYVVREWAPGESLDLVLADGPLTHRRAGWLVHEVAEAVSAAHESGIYHLRLTPENVLVTDTGGVKIIGLATDAALHGVRHADAESEDVRALGRLLYAAIVGRWPDGPDCALPTAPYEHGRLLRPRQVRAGVPRPIDQVCDRILGDPPRHHAEPLRHAAAVAAELSATVRLATDSAGQPDPEQTQAVTGLGTLNGTGAPAGPDSGAGAPTRGGPGSTRRIPVPPVPETARTERTAGPTSGSWAGRPTPPLRQSEPAATVTAPAPEPPVAPPPAPPAPGHDSRRRRYWAWAGVAAVVVLLAAVSFVVGLNSAGGPGGDVAPPSPDTTTPASNLMQPVGVSAVSAWDPFGEEGENDESAPLVLDGDPSTEWTTLSYEGDPRFGGLKPGLGLVLDLGKPTDVSRVTLGLRGSGTDLEVRAAPRAAVTRPDDPGGFATVGSASDASGRTVVKLTGQVSTRYLLVWLTELPPEPGSTYQGRISEITVGG